MITVIRYERTFMRPLLPDEGSLFERLRQRLAARASGEGVWLDSRAWIVGAARR